MLRVQSHKSLIRFKKGSKLATQFIGLFEILERIGLVSYYLALPPSLSRIHDVFHISVLRGYIYDESHIIDWNALQVDSNRQIALEAIHILARWTLTL